MNQKKQKKTICHMILSWLLQIMEDLNVNTSPGTLNIIHETPAEDQQRSRQSKAVLHLHDALGEVGRYFSQTFPTTVHYVVVAGAAGRTHGYLRNTGPRLRLSRTCRRRQIDSVRQKHRTAISSVYCKKRA